MAKLTVTAELRFNVTQEKPYRIMTLKPVKVAKSWRIEDYEEALEEARMIAAHFESQLNSIVIEEATAEVTLLVPAILESEIPKLF